MDRIEPREPMLRIDPSDLIDNKDRCAMYPSSRCGFSGRRRVRVSRGRRRVRGLGRLDRLRRGW
jgi:hypothetical protein